MTNCPHEKIRVKPTKKQGCRRNQRNVSRKEMNMAWNKIKTKNTKFPFDMTPPKVYMQRKKDENSLEF